MKSPFTSEQQVSEKAILVLDDEGTLGSCLIRTIQEHDDSLQAVFITEKKENLERTTVISLRKNKAFIPSVQYAHIFVIYRGESMLRSMIPGVLKKADEDRKRVVMLIHYSDLSDPLFSKISSYTNISLVICGDLFGSEKFIHNGPVNTFLHSARSLGRIVVPGDGMSHIRFTHVQDAVAALLKGALSTKKQAIILAYPKHPPTALRLAHEIQKNDPNVKIDFGKDVSRVELPVINGEYLFDRYPLRERIQASYMQLDGIKRNPLVTMRHVRKAPMITPVSVGIFIVLILLLPLIVSGVGAVTGGVLLKHTLSETEKGNLSDARRSAGIASTVLTHTESVSEIVRTEFSYLGKEDMINTPLSFISVEKEAAQASVYGLNAAIRYTEILAGKSKNPDADILIVVNDAKNATILYQKLRAENNFERMRGTVGAFFYGSTKEELFDTLDYLVDISGTLLDSAPKILGFGKKTSYLVLFQNNMELRPGGGFIGSYGIASFENGRLIDFPIKDVYDADGQLKGHIEPPFAIRRHIPSVHQYLRDSNFDPDFSRNASAAAFILNQETGEVVDGVMAVDILLIKSLLQAIGSVSVPDYGEVVSADNMYMLTQTHAEKNSFAGSSQKKDFLRSLFTALQMKIFDKKTSYLFIARAIKESIEQKHLMIAFADPSIQSIVMVNGMSSSLWDEREEDSVTVNDFLGISEANLGVNKANYFVKRKINQQVSVDESGVVHSTVEIKYINESNAWPGGDYKNYLRVVLPFGALLQGVSIDGEDQVITPAITDPRIYEAKTFKLPKGLEVEKVEEGERVLYGFLVTVPQGGAVKTVTISYAHPHKVSYSQQFFTYDLKFFKQPGTDTSPYALTFFYPDAFKPTKVPAGAISNGQSVAISSDTATDKKFRLEFGKK